MRNHEAALDQLLELALLFDADLIQRLAAQGLTSSRAQLLWELRKRGPSTQRALAEALKVSPRNITGLVDALVETGFVSREPHPTDRRATLVGFTARGRAVASGMAEAKTGFAERLFVGMSDRRFAGMTAGLADVLDRMRSLVEEAR